jgi:hypothetical protein
MLGPVLSLVERHLLDRVLGVVAGVGLVGQEGHGGASAYRQVGVDLDPRLIVAQVLNQSQDGIYMFRSVRHVVFTLVSV